MHQQLHVIRNTAHRPSTQANYTTSRVRPKRKIGCAAAQIAATQIAATLTISFPRWRHMSLTSYWGQQRMSLTSYPGHASFIQVNCYWKFTKGIQVLFCIKLYVNTAFFTHQSSDVFMNKNKSRKWKYKILFTEVGTNKVYSFIEITSDIPHMFTIKVQVIQNTAHRPSTQASYTIGSGTIMQENQGFPDIPLYKLFMHALLIQFINSNWIP